MSETQQQIKNIEQVFSLMDKQPKRTTCKAAGLVSDAQKLIQEIGT